MKLLLIFIIVFLAILYVYTYIKYKKRKKTGIDAVGDYRRTYLEKEKDSAPPVSKDGYTNYLTKHNSTLDYIEKEAFLNEPAKDHNAEKSKPKKFHF